MTGFGVRKKLINFCSAELDVLKFIQDLRLGSGGRSLDDIGGE